MKKQWGVFIDEDSQHVAPINDSQEHDLHFDCKCNPSIEEIAGHWICIHYAFDGRDAVEQAEEFINELNEYDYSNDCTWDGTLEEWDYEMTWKGRLKLWLFVTWLNNIRSPICAWIDRLAIRWLEGRQYHVEDYESEPPRTEITNDQIHYCSRCGTGLGVEGDYIE